VLIDNRGAAHAMTSRLIALGHRRIGFIVGHPSYAASAQRLTGYLQALGDAGQALDLALVQQGQYDFASGEAAAEALLDLPAPPTAIFASSDDMAAGVLAAAHRRGVLVPGELSVAGFDDTDLARSVWPPLSTVHQPVRALAYEAADILFAASPEPERRQLSFDLVMRGSTAAPVIR
jgi:LacI family transcriptional regulator